VNGEAAKIVASDLALTGVETHAQLDIEGPGGVDDHLATTVPVGLGLRPRASQPRLISALLPHCEGSLWTVPGRASGQGDKVCVQRPVTNDRVSPFVETDHLGQDLGAVAVRVARDRVDGDPQVSHRPSPIGRGKRRRVGLRQEGHGVPRLWAATSEAKTDRALRTRATAPSG